MLDNLPMAPCVRMASSGSAKTRKFMKMTFSKTREEMVEKKNISHIFSSETSPPFSISHLNRHPQGPTSQLIFVSQPVALGSARVAEWKRNLGRPNSVEDTPQRLLKVFSNFASSISAVSPILKPQASQRLKIFFFTQSSIWRRVLCALLLLAGSTILGLSELREDRNHHKRDPAEKRGRQRALTVERNQIALNNLKDPLWRCFGNEISRFFAGNSAYVFHWKQTEGVQAITWKEPLRRMISYRPSVHLLQIQ